MDHLLIKFIFNHGQETIEEEPKFLLHQLNSINVAGD